EMSSAATSPRWLCREMIDAIFTYVFDVVGCQMVCMRTSVNNKSASGRGINRISSSFGFHQIILPRFYGRNEDGILHIFYEEQWRSHPLCKANNLEEQRAS